MMYRSNTSDIEKYLEGHPPVSVGGDCSEGSMFGQWRVEAFIAKGGNGEVYRVVNVKTKQSGALKISSKSGLASERLRREADFLASHDCKYFPSVYERGEKDARPFFVMELLEPLDLPRTDDAIARLLCEIGDAVALLHRHGFVHRDIKPANVMYRPAPEKHGEKQAVLIDLGLLKRHEESERLQGDMSVTVVDGRPVGAGTPRYAAPEQFSGGTLSPAADVHALGILADECFGGNPPSAWKRIIERTTSSLPRRRYADVASFLRAIRCRHRRRNIFASVVAASVAAAVFVFAGSLWVGGGREKWTWYSASENMTTNYVSEKLVSVSYKTNRFGVVYPSRMLYRKVTNEVEITIYRLNGKTNVFEKPIVLSPKRETWILGPGFFDAAFVCPEGKAKVRLERCFFNNRSKELPEKAGIRYELTKGVYMNFTEHKDIGRCGSFIEPFDGAYNVIRCKGPETQEEYRDMRQKESMRDLMREF